MRMGFDLHKTIDSKPEFFKYWLEFCVQKNHKVFIISGPPKEEINTELRRLGFECDLHYHEIISVVDFLKSTGCKMWQDDLGDWWAEECDWWASKAKICEVQKIDTLVDDKEEYQEHFNGSDTLFWLWR